MKKQPQQKPAADNAGGGYTELGQLVRQLHQTLHELGCDQAMQSAVGELPDTQDRLNYIAQLTEQAAQRSLNAVEIARPLQSTLESGALALTEEWRAVQAKGNGEWRQVAEKMHAFLEEVPVHTRATTSQLGEIMMAQDFQDLTGQVIKKVAQLTQNLEHQLVHILLISKPAGQPAKDGDALLNGPLVKKGSRTDAVNNQAEVDDLLSSLGF